MEALKIWEEGEVTVNRKKKIRRFTGKKLRDDFLSLFSLEKGLLHTIWMLAVAPGSSIRAFLDTNREELTNPLKYFILFVSIYIFLSFQLHQPDELLLYLDDQPGNPGQLPPSLLFIRDYFLAYLNFWLALNVLFFALFSYWLYKSLGFNFSEHLIIQTFLFSQATLVLILITLLSISPLSSWAPLLFVLIVFYYGYAFYQLFGQSLTKTILKTFLVLIGSLLTFIIALMVFIIAGGIIEGIFNS